MTRALHRRRRPARTDHTRPAAEARRSRRLPGPRHYRRSSRCRRVRPVAAAHHKATSPRRPAA